MPVARRSLRLTAIDMARVEALRDRCGPRASASEAVRVALHIFLGSLPREDMTAEVDQLATETDPAASPSWTTWGISLPPQEGRALNDAAANEVHGLRRTFSRNEVVRLALLSASDAKSDVHAAYAALPRTTRGRPATPSKAPLTDGDHLLAAKD